eukprot:RCo029924
MCFSCHSLPLPTLRAWRGGAGQLCLTPPPLRPMQLSPHLSFPPALPPLAHVPSSRQKIVSMHVVAGLFSFPFLLCDDNRQPSARPNLPLPSHVLPGFVRCFIVFGPFPE